MRIRVPNNFTPRPYQAKYMRYFDSGGKRAVWVVHRRGGKDLTALHQTCKMAHQRRSAYWHVFPTAEQGRKAIWEGFTKSGERIMEQVFPAAIRKSPKEFLPKAEMVVELKCGSIWRLMGSDQIEVVGAGPAGVVFSEYAVAKPSAWNLIRPMLRENDGWASFIFTPRGNNHGKKLYDVAQKEVGWFHDLQTLYDTRAYDPDLTIASERAEGMPEALIQQEYMCSFTAANVGAVFGDLLPAPEDFDHPLDGVYTSWDLGVSDATAIWFWRLNGEGVDFIDHYEATGKNASHFIDVIESKKYSYVRHYLPHDARSRTWVTSATPVGTLETRWPGKVDLLPQDTIANGIEAGRWLLQKGSRFHARCSEGIEALKAYHYEWDDDRKVLARTPLHDWSSHTADAFRYAASVVRVVGLIDAPTPEPLPPDLPMIFVDDNGMTRLNRTFNDLSRASINRRPRNERI